MTKQRIFFSFLGLCVLFMAVYSSRAASPPNILEQWTPTVLPAREAPAMQINSPTMCAPLQLGPDINLVYLPVVQQTGQQTANTNSNKPLAALAFNQSQVTNFADAITFLYEGPGAVQTGVQAGIFDPDRVAVVRGRVIDRSGAPLPDATVYTAEFPEYGKTTTQPDGRFSLVVNGGTQLTICIEKNGYLPAQRQVQPAWRAYTWLDAPVALIQPDPLVTTIDLTDPAPMQAAQGSSVTDPDGTRQSTLLIPQGTTAELQLPGGLTQTITTLNLRTTEYTVGANGPAAMPGTLPPASGYTYAAEFTVDEALAAGATGVSFNQPLFNYVENFLNFPVGTPVPVGSFSPTETRWTPEQNGRVVAILNIVNGLALLDVDGSGTPATPTQMSDLGITEAEQAMLAALYTPGDSLWRVPVPHFSAVDYNWPFGPGPNDGPPDPPIPPNDNGPKPNTCNENGSIIECQNQVLGERVGITGTPFTLNYRSSRMPGFSAARTTQFQVTGSTVPSNVLRIELEIHVAGRVFTDTLPNLPNQSYTWTWDGLDGYGRSIQGTQTAIVRLGNVVPGNYRQPGGDNFSFGTYGGAVLSANLSREEITLWRSWPVPVTNWDARDVGLGGWTLSAHHTLDPDTGIVRFGSGTLRDDGSTAEMGTIAGTGDMVSGPDGGLASETPLRLPNKVAYGDDGAIYLHETFSGSIRRIAPDGTINTVAGPDVFSTPPVCNADGQSVDNVQLGHIYGIDVDASGVIYAVNLDCVFRLTPGGLVEVLIPTASGIPSDIGDGGPAAQAHIRTPSDIVVAPDGSIYVAEFEPGRVRRIDLNGIIDTVAGGGSDTLGDGQAATSARLGSIWNIALNDGGDLLITHLSNSTGARVRIVTPDGIINTIAGGGPAFNFLGNSEGMAATDVSFNDPHAVSAAPDGTIIFFEGQLNAVYRIDQEGFIHRIIGNKQTGFAPDGTLPLQAALAASATDMVYTPDGALLLAEPENNRIRRIGLNLAYGGGSEIIVPASDGGEMYVFDHNGRHLRTEHALTGAIRFTFDYDADCRLIRITDGDGDETTIEHDTAGNPTAIVGPYGQRTTLTVDANGFLASMSNPAGEAYQMTYTSEGLLQSFADPRSFASQFSYDANGRLLFDDDPGSGSW
ncbi:MAG: hypothetical protein H6662_19740, partial [Ardenticatenaceae bacterium]|nr:hypothetical protein [Ardenticatenaceae bacterium]